jgi:hypothetical protein
MFPGHRDLEHDRIPGLDPQAIVARDALELAGQEPLSQLGEVKGCGLPTGTPPEPRGDGNHGHTFDRECFRDVTRHESLRDGAEVGGYPSNLNVIPPGRWAALPSWRAAAPGAVVPLTPAG